MHKIFTSGEQNKQTNKGLEAVQVSSQFNIGKEILTSAVGLVTSTWIQ